MAALVVIGVACSASEATNNIGTMDAPARRACQDVQALVQARSSSRIATGDLRARAQQIYDEASASANPIIQVRAVALFTDATLMAEGDEGRTFDMDLTALRQACSGPGAAGG